jgi:chemotaxis protein MotB
MAVKKPPEEVAIQDSTMVLFTSISLILLTFFIMMTAKANFDETRYGKVIRSVTQTFGSLTGGLAPGGPDGLAVNQPSLGEMGVVRDVEMAQIRALLSPNLMDDQARIVHNRGQRIITLSSNLLFNGDSAELNPEAEETLRAFARIMRNAQLSINIEGHTDNLPPQTEGVGDNWDISLERALTVLQFLAGEGLSLDLLAAYGYGGEKPIVANNTPARRARNNRVDLVLDFTATQEGALRQLDGGDRMFDFEGFEFILPAQPGQESEVY